MKKLLRQLQFALPLLFVFMCLPEANGQLLKKLGKAAERAAERTVERRVEQETSEKTDEVLDSILEPGSKGGNQQQSPIPNTQPPEDSQVGGTDGGSDSGSADGTAATDKANPKSITVYSKFDFVPGDEPLFIDDFSKDFVGDFPSKWNSNGSGELVNIEGTESKWLKILPGHGAFYIPDVTNFPEEFTLEFDVIADGLNKKTSSEAHIQIMIGDNNTFDKPKNYGMIEYPLCQYIARDVIVENNINAKREIRSGVGGDIRETVLEPHHISIAVNEQRFRLWINEQKLVDVPRLLPANVQMQGIKFHVRNIDINVENVYLSNFKMAGGGVDLRKKLLADGKISTNGILFDSGSANIQPQSMGIIRQIYQVLEQDGEIQLKIVGHTDADGDSASNMKLSKSRADAVKNALVSVYNVQSDRLSTEGKGESEPVGDNDSLDGKAQNRRVEFIKQ